MAAVLAPAWTESPPVRTLQDEERADAPEGVAHVVAAADVVGVETEFVEALRPIVPSQEHQGRLLAMLQAVDEWLSGAGVTYWVTGGTLLGAIRHKGIIPHDDDIDIEIFACDLPKAIDALGSVGRSFRGLGNWPGSNVPAGRFFFWDSSGDTRFTASVDVFLREDELLQLDEFPSREETFPLQRIPFHNITVPAPSKAGDFLSRCYSASWRDEVVIWSHGSKSRAQLRASIASYVVALEVIGYEPPRAAANASESLRHVGLESIGELESKAWNSLGWASPWAPACEGVNEEDPTALAMLGLESARMYIPEASSESVSGMLEQFHHQTGAFVDLVPSSIGEGREICIVGESEEVLACREAVEKWLQERSTKLDGTSLGGC